MKSFTIRKCIKKFLNESITFLFIGQGQKDTWHHLRGLPVASSSRNLEKNTCSHLNNLVGISLTCFEGAQTHL